MMVMMMVGCWKGYHSGAAAMRRVRRWKEHAHVPGLARLLLHLWGSDVAIVAATQSHRQREETELAETFQVPASPATAEVWHMSRLPQLLESSRCCCCHSC